MLALVMELLELLEIHMWASICWYLTMLKMEIYITIYQKTLKKLLGKIRFILFVPFHTGKVLNFYCILDSLFLINKYLVKYIIFLTTN